MFASSLSHLKPLRSTLSVALHLCVASIVALSAASVAQAGEYHVYACQKPDGTPAPADRWEAGERNPADTQTLNQCPGGQQLWLNLGTATRGTDAFAHLSMTLPPELRAVAMRATRSVAVMPPSPNGDWNGTPMYGLYRDSWAFDNDHIMEACVYAAGCRGVAWAGVAGGSDQLAVDFDRGGTNFVGFAVACGGTPGGYCASGPDGRAQLHVRAIDLTVRDSDSPSAESVQGTLLQQGARSGTGTVSFTAKDSGAGVYHAIAYVDGQEVRRLRPDDGASCGDAGALPGTDLEFVHLQPCKRTVAAAFSLDTTAFADGKHDLVVKVRDAAGNLGIAVDQQVSFDNVPPPSVKIKPTISGATLAGGLRPGDIVKASNGLWNGADLAFARRWQRNTAAGTWVDIANATGESYTVVSDDVGHALRVAVVASNGEGSTEAVSEATGTVMTGATVKTESQPKAPAPAASPVAGPVGSNGAGGNPSTGQLVVDREQRTVDVRYGAKIVITGRLLDGENQPIADASVDVFEQIAITAAPWVKIGTIRTDSQGGYVFRPKTTASRRLRFAFSDRRDAADYRATREVFVSVTAGMTIKAKRRVVVRQGLIRLSGRVDIDQLPAKGAWVEVQVLDAGVWRTVATRRLDARGRWAFKHRLRQSSLVTFTFRARLRAAGDIASAESKSTPVKVRVR